jgi:hypothetical protein
MNTDPTRAGLAGALIGGEMKTRNVEDRADWANFATWKMRMWMANEVESAIGWQEVIDGLRQNDELSGDERKLCKALACELQSEAEAFISSYSRTLAFELLEAALAEVNWLELAEELLIDLDNAF